MELHKNLILLLLSIFFISGQALGQTRAKELARLEFVTDSASKAYVAKNNTHAITLGVIEGAQTQAYSFGSIDPTDNRLATAHTVFEIGPMSQTFTATLLGIFVNNGSIDLETSILEYLPDTLKNNPVLKDITVKMLANHTAGLPMMPDNFADPDSLNSNNPYPEFPLDPIQEYSKEDLYAYLLHYKGSEIVPGSDYKQSNLGYALLGVMLTEVSGKSYEELLIEYINKPLGLTNTGTVPYENQDYAMSHILSGAMVVPGTYKAFAGSLGVKSSLKDLLLLVRAHFALPETETEHALSLTRQFTYYIPPETDLGLAWEMNLKQEHLVYSYKGDANASSTYIAFAPDGRKAVVILSNAAETVQQVGDAILDALLNVKPAR